MRGKILIAASDNDMLFLLNGFLKKSGFEVSCCSDGSDIIEGKISLPDVFILDKEIRSIDGIAISKFLKLHRKTANTPIIFISNNQFLKKKAVEIGVADFAEKPFDLNHILSLIEKNLDLTEAN